MTHVLTVAVVALSGVSLLQGCAEPKSPWDVLQTRNREQINQRRAELEPLVGEYEGTIREARSNQEAPFGLNIVESGEEYDAGITEETSAPGLSASIRVYTLETRSQTYVTVPFSRSDYDARIRRLNFFTMDRGATLLIRPNSDYSVLSGQWSDSDRGVVGDFEVRRVRPRP